MGDQAAYIGPIGAGSIAKLVDNRTSAVLGVALAEVFTMRVKAGVDPVDFWQAVRQGATVRVRTFDRLGQRFLTGQRALELQASAHTLDSVGYGGPMVTSKILPHRRNPVPMAQMGPGPAPG
jgi:3-hydroxyisobutyrate dehydrogenase-like beta-hydroxyacid dehydrogenase